MWTLSRLIGMGILCSFSIADIQFRSVPAEWLVLAGAAAAVYQVLAGPVDLTLAAGGAAVGLLFLAVSKVTRQALGYGDSWAILILGIFLGFWGVVEVLTGAFFLLVAISMLILALRKMSRRYRLPFFPFLTAGYVLAICLGGPV